jgi:hypothetical protein
MDTDVFAAALQVGERIESRRRPPVALGAVEEMEPVAGDGAERGAVEAVGEEDQDVHAGSRCARLVHCTGLSAGASKT